MSSSLQLSISDYQALVAELRAQNTSMQAGFSAYAQAVKHHSLVLAGVQQELKELKQESVGKDARIDDLERRINELEEGNGGAAYQQKPQEQHDEGPSVQSAIGAALEQQNALLRQMVEENEDEITDLEQEIARLKVGETDSRRPPVVGRVDYFSRKKVRPAIGSKTNAPFVDEKKRAGKSAAPEAVEKRVRALEKKPKASTARAKMTEDERKKADQSLLEAAKKGRLEEVKVLIATGANVDAVNHNGWTSLMLAASNDQLAVVEVLIATGADVDAVDCSGSSSLVWAALHGHFGVVEVLIAAGANVDAVSRNGCTSLMLASWDGHVDVVGALVNAGASLNFVNISRNRTALDRAKSQAVVEILRAAGAKRATEI